MLPATGVSPLWIVVVAVIAIALGVVVVRCGWRRVGPVGVVVAIAVCGLGWSASADAASDCPPVTTPAPTTLAPTTTSVAVLPTAAPSTTTSPSPTTTLPPTTTTSTTTTTTSTSTTSTIPVAAPAVGVSFRPAPLQGVCEIYGSMTGFLPDSAYTMVLSQSNSPAVPPAGGISFQVQTDGQGAATMRVLDVVEEFVLYFSVTVDGVTSPWAAVAC